ncbi:adenosine deaminase [Priestia megaterium]|uniref:adenine deaminase n=1 Tax=Priestia megaterium TaxID=1404 RepID=A0A3D8WUX5_PRIMG|nr:adenine deaminase C-terminal domain-containing protein [Priestia megaterium]MDH3173176.1 adenine deaminase C-terminal domain-containing protein [Priestia megaterium]RDZ08032.1 adenosine deaminase [Priestia megaterium]
MPEQRYRWKSKHIRQQLLVLNGQKAPTIVLKDATYLNARMKQWKKAHIWVYQDRIVYVGSEMPKHTDASTEIIDCSEKYVVPGYIEPHVHPFQLYNPQTFSQYAAKHGTTTLFNDNLILALQLEQKTAFSLIEEMKTLPQSLYWWCRFDSQTEIDEEADIFSHTNITSWLQNEAVLQGGELTSWPKLLDGDDLMLHWVQETKRMRKHIEGHFPGASAFTLAKMKLLGADSDHESMTGEDVVARLTQGYDVALRHSSIRPDLPKLLQELKELGVDYFDHITMNTDGSPPSFYQNGVSDMLITLAISEGVPVLDAYNMVSVNIARYYNMEHLHGHVATGCVANINILEDPMRPTPVSVLAKGKWMKKEGKEQALASVEFPWEKFGFSSLKLDFDLTMDDFQFSMPVGVKMKNAVIMEPYSIHLNVSGDVLASDHDESFLVLVDREGKWRINTLLKGFATNVSGLASSFSNTGDFILIGKSKKDMMCAFKRMKEIGGGIVITEDEKVVYELDLPLKGVMSNLPMEELSKREVELKKVLGERGYKHDDPVYSLLFFSSTHLPYIRITPVGIYDVMNKKVLFPSIMR